MYLDYEEYVLNGGTVEQSVFLLLEKLAEKKLNCWTFHRIVETTEDIRLAMTLIINALPDMQGDKVSGFSNDGVSISFEQMDESQELYRQICEILPSDLTYLGI